MAVSCPPVSPQEEETLKLISEQKDVAHLKETEYIFQSRTKFSANVHRYNIFLTFKLVILFFGPCLQLSFREWAKMYRLSLSRA